jgi:hypothetical protein
LPTDFPNKRTHSIGEGLVLPVAIDIVETTLVESHAKEIPEILLLYDTMGRRISDMPEDICDRLKTQGLALQHPLSHTSSWRGV